MTPPYGTRIFTRWNVNDVSSIMVSVQGSDVWVRVACKATFLNSPGLKTFARELIVRGYRRFLVDLGDCPGMDSTFMGTLTGMALDLGDNGKVEISRINERNLESLCSLGVDNLFLIHEGAEKAPAGGEVLPQKTDTDTRARTMLEAHEALVSADPHNLAKFKEVLQFLRQDLARIQQRAS